MELQEKLRNKGAKVVDVLEYGFLKLVIYETKLDTITNQYGFLYESNKQIDMFLDPYNVDFRCRVLITDDELKYQVYLLGTYGDKLFTKVISTDTVSELLSNLEDHEKYSAYKLMLVLGKKQEHIRQKQLLIKQLIDLTKV